MDFGGLFGSRLEESGDEVEEVSEEFPSSAVPTPYTDRIDPHLHTLDGDYSQIRFSSHGHSEQTRFGGTSQPIDPQTESVQAMLHLLRAGRIRFSDFLQSTRNLGKTPGPQKKTISKRVAFSDRTYTVEPTDKEIFSSDLLDSAFPTQSYEDYSENDIIEMAGEGDGGMGEVREDEKTDSAYPTTLPDGAVGLMDWEQSIIWDESENRDLSVLRPETFLGIPTDTRPETLAFLPEVDTAEDWTGLVVWEEQQGPSIERKRRILFERELSEASRIKKCPASLDRYNIGNDRLYESGYRVKSNRFRQPLGQITLSHAVPALKLQAKSHKQFLSTADKRSFHRPPFRLPLNTDLQIAHVKGGKKGMMNRDNGDPLVSTKELGLKDGVNFVLLEYSEEYPPLLNNLGMASLIHRYFRKMDENDNQVPESEEYGSVYALDTMDQSPFFGFGDVSRGDIVTALYNNMYRAPIFRHDVRDGDFVLVSDSKYFIREIPAIFVVGQTLPSIEVPGPTSRKGVGILRNRMQVFATRLQRANPQAPGFKMEVIAREFTGINDMQLRQKLKEFANYNRRGEHSGYWRVKEERLSEEELQKLVLPEQKEIQRIWDAQRKSLSDKRGPQISEEEENFLYAGESRNHQTNADRWVRAGSPTSPPPMSPSYGGPEGNYSDAEEDAASVAESLTSGLRARSGKILVITREYQMQDGSIRTRTTVIEDPRIAKFYTKQRDLIERYTDSNRFRTRIAALKAATGHKVSKRGGRGRGRGRGAA
ncbi:hypothetical protein HDU93_006418 [Gonapodya sp. JEL0774]|nr:hypothetical protein HDU93_006418 [Gonapodya sp. JEL0774]